MIDRRPDGKGSHGHQRRERIGRAAALRLEQEGAAVARERVSSANPRRIRDWPVADASVARLMHACSAMADYGHELEFGYFLISDANDREGFIETARLAARLRPALELFGPYREEWAALVRAPRELEVVGLGSER